jgi:hypothetical protein
MLRVGLILATALSLGSQPCNGSDIQTNGDTGSAGGDGSECSATAISVQSYDATKACFGTAMSLQGACYVPAQPSGKSVSAVCGLGPDGKVYVAVIGTNDTVSASGWTFAREGTLQVSLSGQPLSGTSETSCDQAIAAWHQTPRTNCM